MTQVVTDKKWTRPEYLWFDHANTLLAQQEIMSKAASDKMAQWQKVFAEAVVESRKGVAWKVLRVNTIGRKAI